jgi:hypothetical protein
MKHFLVAVIAVVFASSAFAESKQVSVKGEVVDTVCYLTKGAKGPSHKACAQACLKGGNPAALLSEGKLYMLLADHGNSAAMDQVKAHGGDVVTVTGEKLDKDGLAAIMVSSVK